MLTIKPLPALLGALVLSLSMTATALPTLAQSDAPMGPPPGESMRRPPNFLNLTEEQQAKLEQIRQNERSQIEAILTTEQKAQLQREMANRRGRGPGRNQGQQSGGNQRPGPNQGQQSGGNQKPQMNQGQPRSPFESLNLTADQKARIAAVMKSSREQRDAVLTPEQRQQLQQLQQRRPNGPQAPQSP